MFDDAWQHVHRLNYWYNTDPSFVPFLVGIVAGVVIASALIWLVFRHGVSEARLFLWVTGCAACGLLAGVLIYQALLPFGSCWAWFGC